MSFTPESFQAPSAANAIVRENQRPGTTDWLVTRVEDAAANQRDDRYRRQRAIEGYVSRTSVGAGDTLTAFVSTSPAASYRADVYRLGCYGGTGGRLIARLGPFSGTVQPDPVDGPQQLIQAGWAKSFDIRIGGDWPSGVYVAKLTTIGRGLEASGYDVTFASNLDTHNDADGLVRVKGLLSVGHDEYWTRRMFENVARARNQGVSLAFLSGNAVDGEITLAPSSDGRADRTFERFTGRGAVDDMPDEETLMGSTSYGVGLGDWIVTRPEHWLFAGTGMKAGDRIAGLVGWEHHGPPYRADPSLEVAVVRTGDVR